MEIPSCTNIFDKFMFCTTPPSQIGYLRHFGDYQDCISLFGDWTTCLNAKLVMDSDKKEVTRFSSNIFPRKLLTNKTIVMLSNMF